MPLESLMELVDGLRERIETHGDALRQNERLTRYALIDPLLRELGWDTTDPGQVVPEYRVPNNQFADYVLLAGGAPKIVVESKKLDEPLQGAKALDQGILYCAHTGSTHFLLTDGRRWEIYESSKTTPKVRFDLKLQRSAEVCLKALALWRPAVEAGHVATGEPPVTKLPHGQPDASEPTAPNPPVSPPVADERQWQLLNEVTAVKGQNPNQIRFPNGTPVKVKNWTATLEEVVRWLSDRRILQADDCPVIGNNPKAFRYMVHTQPIHSNGDPFHLPLEVNGLWVEKHDNRQALINKTKTIIEHVGQDPAKFKVRFD